MAEEVTEQAAEATVAELEAPPKRAPGRLLAAFGFLFALGALAAVGYLYFLLVYSDPSAGLVRGLAQAAGERAALRDDVHQLEERLRLSEEGRSQAQAEWAAQVDERREVLRAATAYGGEAFGDRMGQVRPDYLADLLLVDGDPLSDLTLFQDPANLLAIMKDGRFHKQPPARHADGQRAPA